MNRMRLSVVAMTVAMLVLWLLVERTFMAITDGLEAAVEVSQVSADASGSVAELSQGLTTLIDSVDGLATNAQSLATDASSAANSVADASSGGIGNALTATSRTTARLAPVVGFVEGLTGGKGAAKDLTDLSETLKPLPKDLDRIAADLRKTAGSLEGTAKSLDKVHTDLATTKATLVKGQVAIGKLPSAAKKAELAAAGPLERLRFNLWLWRIALLALWVAGVTSLSRRPRHIV
jgi:multidrug resistance efflux pump